MGMENWKEGRGKAVGVVMSIHPNSDKRGKGVWQSDLNVR